jgi:putative membrane protein
VLAATFLLVVPAFVYLRGWLRLRLVSPGRVPIWRLTAFTGGLILVWAVTATPLAMLDHLSLTFHMVKHLLLMTVAAPLVLAGAPTLPLRHGLPIGFVHGEQFRRSRPARWAGRWVAHPVVGWVAATVAVIGWHLPGPFQLAMRSPWMHGVEDACFLLAGLLFWRPIMIAEASPRAARSSRWWIALYLFLATLPCDILSAFLTFCNRVVYPCYLSTTRPFGLTPLQDQECAGALMWVWVTFAYLIPAVVITMQILSPMKNEWHEPAPFAWPRRAAQSPDPR